LLGGCGDDDTSTSTSQEGTVPPATAGPSLTLVPTSAIPTTPVSTSATVPDELTHEENLAKNPPPPADVRVVSASVDSVKLAWDPPPPVDVPHGYSDRVVAYHVYRRTGGDLEFRPLAETPERRYVDTEVDPGQTYEYTVSSIREQNVEGSRSDPPAVAKVPPG
jgi:fibronectin type 3 domain-containing protein